MTVRDLIQELTMFPMNLEVVIDYPNRGDRMPLGDEYEPVAAHAVWVRDVPAHGCPAIVAAKADDKGARKAVRLY